MAPGAKVVDVLWVEVTAGCLRFSKFAWYGRPECTIVHLKLCFRVHSQGFLQPNLTYKHPSSEARPSMLSFGQNPRPGMLNFEIRMVLQLYVLVYQDTFQISISIFLGLIFLASQKTQT